MFGTSHCCDSSSCYSDTFEFEPASAGAERQTLLSERVVCAPSLCFEHTTYCRELKHTPNAYKLEASNTRSSDRTCAAETLGCRRVESNEKESTRFRASLAYTTVHNSLAEKNVQRRLLHQYMYVGLCVCHLLNLASAGVHNYLDG